MVNSISFVCYFTVSPYRSLGAIIPNFRIIQVFGKCLNIFSAIVPWECQTNCVHRKNKNKYFAPQKVPIYHLVFFIDFDELCVCVWFNQCARSLAQHVSQGEMPKCKQLQNQMHSHFSRSLSFPLLFSHQLNEY